MNLIDNSVIWNGNLNLGKKTEDRLKDEWLDAYARKERAYMNKNDYYTTSTFGPIGVTSSTISASSLWSPFTGRDRISFKGEEYDIQEVQICSDGTIEIKAILAHPSDDYYIGIKKVKAPKFRGTNKYGIKKIQINSKKNATTVIFENGHVEVVKRNNLDPEADLYSVVAYAIAKYVYGSNSAFKRQIRDCIFESLEVK